MFLILRLPIMTKQFISQGDKEMKSKKYTFQILKIINGQNHKLPHFQSTETKHRLLHQTEKHFILVLKDLFQIDKIKETLI